MSNQFHDSEEFTEPHATNYRERVDILTDVVVGLFGMLLGNPMVTAMAGPDFTEQAHLMTERLSTLRQEVL